MQHSIIIITSEEIQKKINRLPFSNNHLSIHGCVLKRRLCQYLCGVSEMHRDNVYLPLDLVPTLAVPFRVEGIEDGV